MVASVVKILVVEDDRDLRLYLTNLLRAHGFAPQPADRTDDLVDLVRRLQPSLIILDAMLPADAAQQIYATLKADPGSRHVPVVMLSSLTRRELHASRLSFMSPHARRLPHPDAFLPNPPEAEEFIAVIRRLTASGEKVRQKGDS